MKYALRFYREIVPHGGEPSHVSIDLIEVEENSLEAAVTLAKQEFEHKHKVFNWRDLAEGYEITEM